VRLSTQTLGAGGGRSRAGHTDSKLTLRCDPSQKGLLADCPQRHRPITVRPPKPKGLPCASTISTSPSTRSDPLSLMMILAGIHSMLPECSDAIMNANASSRTICPDLHRRGGQRFRPKERPTTPHSSAYGGVSSRSAELHVHGDD